MSWPLALGIGLLVMGAIAVMGAGFALVRTIIRERREAKDAPDDWTTGEGPKILAQVKADLTREVPVIAGLPQYRRGVAQVYNPRNTDDYQPRRLRPENECSHD